MIVQAVHVEVAVGVLQIWKSSPIYPQITFFFRESDTRFSSSGFFMNQLSPDFGAKTSAFLHLKMNRK